MALERYMEMCTRTHKGQFPAEINGLTGKMHSLSGVVVEEGLGIPLVFPLTL